jgi:hypothetical protein
MATAPSPCSLLIGYPNASVRSPGQRCLKPQRIGRSNKGKMMDLLRKDRPRESRGYAS